MQRSWCLGDGGAYLTPECLATYGAFLGVEKQETIELTKVWANVQEYCGNEETQVSP